MTKRYSSPGPPSLPPGCTHNPIEHTLTLTLPCLQLIEITPKPTLLKLQLWGLPSEQTLEQNGSLVYEIRTSSAMFREYLRDMRVSVVRLCDSRNGEELGTGLVNWLLYIRKTEVKGSPFIDDCFRITVMVYNYKKKQIAELTLEAAWAVYRGNQRDNSVVMEENQMEKSMGVMKNNPSLRASKGQLQTLVRPKQDKKQSIEEQKESYLLSQQKISTEPRRSKRKSLPKVSQQSQAQPNPNIRYPQSKYELQKAQLKLQAEQLLTLTRKNYSPIEQNRESLVTFRICDLVTLKPNTLVQYLDVFVGQKNQEGERRHLRAFPAKDGGFNVEISGRDGDTVEVQAGKVGKGTFEVKSVKGKDIVKAFLYGKAGKVGSITAKKIYESKQNEPKQPEVTLPKAKPKPTPQPKPETQPPSTPIFLLLRILQAKHNYLPQFELAVKNYHFSQSYPSFTIIPLSDLGSIFAIEMRNLENQTVDSVFVEGFAKLPMIENNLGCVVFRSGRLNMENGWVRAEVLLGTMKQVNYELSRETHYRRPLPSQQVPPIAQNKSNMPKSKLKQPSEKPSDRPEIYKINSKEDQSSNSSKLKDEPQISNARKHKRANRKMYTEMLGNERVATEPISEYRMQQNQEQANEQPNDNEGIFLVEVLSKFLHALPVDKISTMPPSTVDNFISLLHHFLANREEKQLIDLVIDMFVDDQVEEGQPYRLEYEEFLKCLRSYHNFLELWWKMRVDVLYELIRSEPDYEQKIVKYSELGTLNKQTFWKKVFPHLDNPELKLKIDKTLKLSTSPTIPSSVLLDQLQKLQKNPHEPPSQASPDLILDLGKLIKQTVESILEGSGLTAPPVVEDRVNIRVMCDVLEKVNIGLSYWEGLMLVEELKGWYGVDLDCNQGIVSGAVVEVWLKSVLNRSKVSSNAQQPKLQAQPEPNPKTPKQNPNPNPLSSNPSQKLKPLQNKSIAKSQLNEEQIENIANLLRDNDNFRMGTFTSDRPVSRVYGNNTNTVGEGSREGKVGGNILDDESLQQSLSDEPTTQKQKPLPPQPTKYLHLTLKSLKLKTPSILPSPFKLTLTLSPQTQHYFLCKSQQQLLNRQLVQQLPSNWQYKSKGLIIQFVRPAGEEGEDGVGVLYGILVNQEILGLGLGAQRKSKTVVLYGNKEIAGKVTLQLAVSLQKPPLFQQQKPTKLTITITPELPHKTEWTHFTIQNLSNPSLSPQTPAQPDIPQQLTVSSTYYRDTLAVIVDGVGSCTVPLEELYFKGRLVGVYPVVGGDGRFVGNLGIGLGCQLGGVMGTVGDDMMVREVKGRESQGLVTTKYLIIFDSLCSLQFPSPTPNPAISLLCTLFLKDAYSRTILYRSPFYIEHNGKPDSPFTQTLISEFSQQNYCIVEEGSLRGRAVTLQLDYEGRCVGLGNGVIKLREIGAGDGARGCYLMRYLGNGKGDVLLGLGLRVLAIPESFSKYNATRIYKSISKQQLPAQSPETALDTLLQLHPKLTVSQQKLTKQLTTKPGSLRTCYPIEPGQQAQLLSEFMSADEGRTGRLSRAEVEGIVGRVLGVQGRGLLGMFWGVLWEMGEEGVGYMGLLDFVGVGEEEEGGLGWQNSLTGSAIQNIDRLHKQIKHKYTNR